MLILALDTATEQGSLALTAADQVLAEIFLDSPGTYLQHLLPGVTELLHSSGRCMQEIAAIAVNNGPGNFTGLRIGLATAKCLAWALNCPLAPVPSLEAIAAQITSQTQPTAVIMDAKRDEIYLGLFRCLETTPLPLAEPQCLPVAALPALLKPPLLLTGPGLNAYGDFLEKHISPTIIWAPPEKRLPRATTIARLGKLRLQHGLTALPNQLAPTYLRSAL